MPSNFFTYSSWCGMVV